ncbi:hypothetical protein PM082_004352 [Marasmius tenuissimus]|nr:hypothetical protein PM082_004352 [Marasmius tenuissimus]
MTPNAELESLEEYLKLVLADKSKRQDLLTKEGDSAQQWLDRMQQVRLTYSPRRSWRKPTSELKLVDYPNLSPELRPTIFNAMLHLSKRSGLHPACLSIQNVKKIGKHPVAAGGFGDVWKGTIGHSSEVVCLKVVRVYLNSDMQKLSIEYQREAILWRQMKHPNLLPLLGIYQLEHTDELCMISPWMENGNLVEFMKATKREDIDHYVLVHDVASGLAYLHSEKIVHGDLKGVNVLITGSLRACIADFGLSRIADTQGLIVTTSTTRPAGTMRWLAPELLSGSERPSKESDVYSFGCVCYEIFTGLLPFAELGNDMAVMFAVAQGKCPLRPQETFGLSDAMWTLMTRCWDPIPTSRPTAIQVLENVGEMVPGASAAAAVDWSDSLLTHVRENVEYRSFSSGSPSGSQLGVNLSFSRGEFPEDINLSQYPPEFKKEGADWFALFNPSVNEGPDVSLVHDLMHDSAVCCVRFSADGKYVATGCNRTTQIYDVDIGFRICLLLHEDAEKAESLWIHTVCFSPDGKYLATGAEDKLVRIWDIEKGRIQNIFAGHGGEVLSVDFSSDGKLLVSGSGDRTVRVWNMTDGSSSTFVDSAASMGNTGVTSVKFSSDGRYIAAGYSNSRYVSARYVTSCLRIWEVATGQLVGRLGGNRDSAYSVAFTPDARGLVSGSEDKMLKYWDVSDRNSFNESPCTMKFVGHKEHVLCVAVSQDGHWIASGSEDCGVRFWDSRTATTRCLLHGHTDSGGPLLIARRVHFELQRSQIFRFQLLRRRRTSHRWVRQKGPYISQLEVIHSLSRGEFPESIDASQYPPEFKKEGADWFALFNTSVEEGSDVSLVHDLMHDSVVCCVRFSADGKYVATGCNRTAQVYDVNTGTKLCLLVDETARRSGDLYIRSVCFSPDGKYLATGAEDRRVRIWDIKKGRIQIIFDGHTQGIYSVDFSSDGRLLVSGSGDKTVRVWNMIDGSSSTFVDSSTLNVDDGVTSVRFSSDGRYVAAGYLEYCVRIWEVATGKLVAQLQGHQNSVYSVAFTPDARGLISASLDKTLKYWDVSNRNRLNESLCTMNFVGHKDYALCVAISRDGECIASGSKDRGVRLWDPRTATTRCSLYGHKNSVIALDFSPSGGVLATAGGDQIARIWRYKLD